MSFNQFDIEFSIINYEHVGRATLIRQLAPRTVALIRYQLRKPIQSRVVVRDGEVDIPLKIGRAGPEESSRKEVQRGEVAYWPQSQVLIIFIKDKTVGYPVNIVGSTRTMKFFDNLSIGKSIRLEMLQPGIDEEDYL
ncbi:MAG: hypothetical protein JSV04_13445 [Candidatus Heimdallarchaeota archaeon]|nr:MAG: hypothetical protein JSV04_13445 [Candidatus Heimdallarchaeota archaeon]